MIQEARSEERGARNEEKESLEPRTSNLYQFPPTHFVTNTPWRQWWHLLSEVIEIGMALLSGDIQHAATETWNAKHSGETMHRILSGRGADIDLARQETLGDNIERGYYQ